MLVRDIYANHISICIQTLLFYLATGLFLKGFWDYTCKPEELYQFYLKAVDETVRKVSAKEQKPCILIGHSAGGWLARAYLADGSKSNLSTIAGLVTLGTPHCPPGIR